MSSLPAYMRDDYWQVPADEVFVHPKWKDISQAIDAEIAEGDRDMAWKLARDRWVASTMEVLNGMLEISAKHGKSYNIGRSEHFTIVSPYKQDIAEDLPTLGENFRRIARQALGEEIASDPRAGHVIFIIHDRHVAQEYLRAFGVNAFAIGGVCLNTAMPHILIHDATRFDLRLVLIHELNHSMLHALPIPGWVHEGLSRYFEARLLTIANMRFTAELDVGRGKYWREHGLKDFWNGAVFHDQRAGAGYVLAHKLILRLMKSDGEAFVKFMLKARREDAGDAACREMYGAGILEMIRDFVGAGEWEGPEIKS